MSPPAKSESMTTRYSNGSNSQWTKIPVNVTRSAGDRLWFRRYCFAPVPSRHHSIIAINKCFQCEPEWGLKGIMFLWLCVCVYVCWTASSITSPPSLTSIYPFRPIKPQSLFEHTSQMCHRCMMGCRDHPLTGLYNLAVSPVLQFMPSQCCLPDRWSFEVFSHC